MILRLVVRSLALRPGRSALLLLGYALGVGVMVALLSIGEALVEQSRDRELLSGGDLVVLPAGIDLETLRTGGVSSLYFKLEQAPYFYREVLAGPRVATAVDAVAPWIDDELLYIEVGESVIPVSAAGEIPSLAEALGAEARLEDGAWGDIAADANWMAPTDQARLTEIDALHSPPEAVAGDTTWAEWHYFSLLSPDHKEWAYVTFLMGGDLASDRWGGQILVTLTSDDGEVRHWRHDVASDSIEFSFGSPDLRLGGSSVTLDPEGRYDVVVTLPEFAAEFNVVAEPGKYLPAVDVSPGGFVSGYAVPVLRGRANARVCEQSACRVWSGARAYHDHNWGTWQDVTWDWGQAHAEDLSVLYGGVGRGAAGGEASAPGSRFLFVFDSLGLAGVLPVQQINYEWEKGTPVRLHVRAARGTSRLELTVDVTHTGYTVSEDATFFQMRGEARIDAELQGEERSESGDGFFETWKGKPDSIG